MHFCLAHSQTMSPVSRRLSRSALGTESPRTVDGSLYQPESPKAMSVLDMAFGDSDEGLEMSVDINPQGLLGLV